MIVMSSAAAGTISTQMATVTSSLWAVTQKTAYYVNVRDRVRHARDRDRGRADVIIDVIVIDDAIKISLCFFFRSF